MAMTAAQSFALGTPDGRDRINQQLRANPQYAAFLRSIGVDPNNPRMNDQQRQQAQAWVAQHMGGIGGLEIDPVGNLNNPHGFGTELKQWGPVAAAAGGIAAPFVLPALGFGGGSAAPSAVSGMGAGEAAVTSAPLGTAGVGSATGAAAPLGTAAAGGGAMSGLKEFFTDPSNLAGIGAVVGGLASGRGSGSEDSEELERISRITEAQMRRADPLHQVAVNLAFGRMPTNYRNGVQLRDVPLPG